MHHGELRDHRLSSVKDIKCLNKSLGRSSTSRLMMEKSRKRALVDWKP